MTKQEILERSRFNRIAILTLSILGIVFGISLIYSWFDIVAEFSCDNCNNSEILKALIIPIGSFGIVFLPRLFLVYIGRKGIQAELDLKKKE